MLVKKLSVVAIFFPLLGIGFSTMAASYLPDIKNCSLQKVGNHLWRAKFDIEISYCSSCTDTEYNWVTVNVPKLDNNGKPAGSNYSDRVDNAMWSNLVLDGSVKSRISSNSIFINGSGSNNIITKSASVSVDFSTDGNNAYPAVFLYNAYSPGSSGGFGGWIYPNSSGSCNYDSKVTPTIPPITEVDPVDPEFKMKSAVWNLETVDVGDLPNIADAGNGYIASIRNVSSNGFCVNYVTAGVKNNSYTLGITNNYSAEYGRNVFMMKNGDSQLLYALKLISNDGDANNNFSFPNGIMKYITLSQSGSGVDNHSEMCWTPQINLFKNSTTVGGEYNDTLNFVVTPRA